MTTSKECLERLVKIAYVEPGPTKEKFITYAREIKHNKNCSDLYNTIKQDLDRLEKIEKNINEQRKIILLTKNMVYFNTFTEKYFIKFLDFLSDNEVYCHIDTIYNLTEIWFSNCGKRKLHKLIIEFNNKEIHNDE